MKARLKITLFLLACLCAGFLTGCTTPESSDNTASRPWNSPRGWESGLPSGINEGR